MPNFTLHAESSSPPQKHTDLFVKIDGTGDVSIELPMQHFGEEGIVLCRITTEGKIQIDRFAESIAVYVEKCGMKTRRHGKWYTMDFGHGDDR